MKQLEDRIMKDGKVRAGGILKVDSFLNHQIDSLLINDMAQEFRRLFAGYGVNKVLTIEASGIAIAAMTAYAFECPLVFAKKSKSKNISDDVWSAEAESFTHGNINTIVVSREYLGPGDNVLIVDDFLATGAALRALEDICGKAGAHVVGAGIAVEKAFQGGGETLRASGLRIESLARIVSMSDSGVEFG